MLFSPEQPTIIIVIKDTNIIEWSKIYFNLCGIIINERSVYG